MNKFNQARRSLLQDRRSKKTSLRRVRSGNSSLKLPLNPPKLALSGKRQRKALKKWRRVRLLPPSPSPSPPICLWEQKTEQSLSFCLLGKFEFPSSLVVLCIAQSLALYSCDPPLVFIEIAFYFTAFLPCKAFEFWL